MSGATFLKHLYFWHWRRSWNIGYPIINIDIWDLLYCLGSLLPRKHLADSALQGAVSVIWLLKAAQCWIIEFSFSIASWYCWKHGTAKNMTVSITKPICQLINKRAFPYQLLPLWITYAQVSLALWTMVLCFPPEEKQFSWDITKNYFGTHLKILPLPSVVFQQKLQERAGPSLAWERFWKRCQSSSQTQWSPWDSGRIVLLRVGQELV